METSWHRIPLDPPVPASHERELTTRVFFVSDAILDFSLVRADPESAGVSAVDLAVPAGTDVGDLARKLRYVVTNDVLCQRQLTPKTVWRANGPAKVRDVYPDLLRQGAVSEAGEGQITVGEPILSLMDHLDARIKDLTVREFGTREFRYPTLIPTSVMRRCGYFQSFPHLMMVVSRLHADVDAYRSFLDGLDEGGDLAGGLRDHVSGFDYCLPPTMCFHTYHQFANRPLPGPALAVTARGKSFRFESRYRRSLERLWDFTIREIVFIGPRDHVLACRRRLMERTWELMDALELGGRCEVANDPFFVSAGTAERVWSQHLLELKYELRLPLEAGRDVAVCSFNFHDRFFGEAFGITTADGTAYTACAGFGLERLAYAFLCRHGVNPRGWPRSTQEAVRA
jgi:seryl-tRNA synthetase